MGILLATFAFPYSTLVFTLTLALSLSVKELKKYRKVKETLQNTLRKSQQ